MAQSASYPAIFTPDESGGYVVTFPDLPEAITQGEDFEQAQENAIDCLEEVAALYLNERRTLPSSSAVRDGLVEVALPVTMAVKAALFAIIEHSGKTQSEVAFELGVDEKEVRGMLDPRHPSKPI